MQIAVKRVLIFLLLICAFLNIPSTRSQPAQVIIIRHAEKPKDADALHLSKQGKKRAEALVPYFKNTPELTQFGPPGVLLATEPTKTGKGQRPGETLEPLSNDLKIPIETPFKSDEYKKLAEVVLANKQYVGKSVLICWTHEYIPSLVAALGVHPKPQKLDEKTYDKVYLITYEAGKAKLKELQQPDKKNHGHFGIKKHP